MALRKQAPETVRDLMRTESLTMPDRLDCTLEATAGGVRWF
jgi:hypothetical protein